MDLKEEELLGEAIDRHWYYVAKAAMLESHLRGPIIGRRTAGRPFETLDIGAGAGWFSRHLLRKGLSDRATCVDPGYAADREEDEGGKPIAFRRSIGSSSADLVLMMDVLEHVDDDVALLSEYLDKTPAGTPVFITVPAFQFLWSAHDVFLEHKRRYTIGMLRETVVKAGARPLATHYYFGAVFPIAAAVRLLRRGRTADRSDIGVPPAPVNALLKLACAAEIPLMRLNRLAGLTVVCLCRR